MAPQCLKVWRRIGRGGNAFCSATSADTNLSARAQYSPPPHPSDEKHQAEDQLSLPKTGPPVVPRTPGRTTVYRSLAESPYAFLGEFDIIFVVDDSSSMLGQRWKETKDVIAAVAPLCAMFHRRGIDICFLNHRCESTVSGIYMNITTAAEVEGIFSSVKPCGTTPFGKRLRQILVPYISRVARMTAQAMIDGWVPDRTLFVRPLCIIAFTDGAFTDNAEGVITGAARSFDACRAVPWQASIQLFQVGTDRVAAQYLRMLGSDLARAARENGFRNIFNTATRRETHPALNAQEVMKCILVAVYKKYGCQDVTV